MSSNGFANTMDDVARDFVSFLAGFYKIHPELDKYESHLWIMGESYAGKYVPAIATLGLLKHGLANRYRFKGIAIGNGYTEPLPMAMTVANSYYALGLIDGNQRDHANARINTCVDLAKASKLRANEDSPFIRQGTWIQRMTLLLPLRLGWGPRLGA